MLVRLLPGHFRRDVDVADHGHPWVGTRQPERDDVGGTATAQVPAVEGRHGPPAEESHGDQRVAHPLGLEHGLHRRDDARARQGNAHSFAADIDDEAHWVVVNSAVTPPLAAG
jgi:hypothetical protein